MGLAYGMGTWHWDGAGILDDIWIDHYSVYEENIQNGRDFKGFQGINS
jgi:hypothetical protein